MAGRLPGVGLPQRKRSSEHHRHQHHHHASYRASSSSLEAPPPCIINSLTALELDETTLKARQRLQKKLGHFFPSIREFSENQKKEGKVVRESSTIQSRDAGIGRKLLKSSWLLRPNRYKKNKERKVCAVCLEDFKEEQHVMNLSCSHKYHSQCLLPWLADHPHCPYCRTPVEH